MPSTVKRFAYRSMEAILSHALVYVPIASAKLSGGGAGWVVAG